MFCRRILAVLLLWLGPVITRSALSSIVEHSMEEEATMPVDWWTDPGPVLGAREPKWDGALGERGQGPQYLTPFGQGIRRVLVASLVPGTCRADDWRGDLPRYLGRFLPQATVVLLQGRHEWHCSLKCLDDDPRLALEESGGGPRSGDCGSFMGAGTAAVPADLVLLVGTGLYSPCGLLESEVAAAGGGGGGGGGVSGAAAASRTTFQAGGCGTPDAVTAEMVPDVVKVLQSAYVGKDTVVVHVPIRKEPELRSLGGLFPAIRHVMDDSEFFKPLSASSITAVNDSCASTGSRTNTLLYIARYVEHKGQLSFLETVDPKELQGYVVHFYGSDYTNTEYRERLQGAAEHRNISAVIHPSTTKLDLLGLYCSASGVVHYAANDNNPRAPYEALYGGNPLLVTLESSLHKDMYKQTDFVVPVAFDDKAGFAAAFRSFMSKVRRAEDIQPEIHRFVEDNLSPFLIYRDLCEEMGVCEAAAVMDRSSRPKHVT